MPVSTGKAIAEYTPHFRAIIQDAWDARPNGRSARTSPDMSIGSVGIHSRYVSLSAD